MLISFLIVMAIRIAIPWLNLGGWTSLVLDIAVLRAVWSVFEARHFIRVLREWSFLRVRDHRQVQKRFTLDIIVSGLKITSLFFVALWFSRWIIGYKNVLYFPIDPQDLTHLDVFIFCQTTALILEAGYIRRLLLRSNMTIGRQILLQYGVAILIATPLLLMPFSLNPGEELSLIDAAFVAVSAISVTGLSPIDIGSVFSQTGLMIILALIQLGGLGIILVIAGFSIARFGRMSMNTILMGQEMYGSRVGDVPRFLGRVVMLTFVVEAIGFLLLYLCLPSDASNRFFTALFHSVSAFCNAGISTFPSGLQDSPFHFSALAVVCLLIIIGGMGFPILLDILSIMRSPKKGIGHLSAYTKLTLTVMGILLVMGSVLFFAFETARPDEQIGFFSRLGYSIFYSVSSRTAGFGVAPTDALHASSLFFLSFLMLLGANPSSTGSGIKTTTVGVLFLAIYNSILGKNQVVFAGRAIPATVVSRALTVVALHIFVACTALVVLVLVEPLPIGPLAFEVISALSTVGFSMGITPELSVFGKIVVITLMLAGRFGILAVLLMSIGSPANVKVRYPEDEFFVG
ncbi:MAG: hypothetical protein M9899_02165 [Bdellovibrionaceae bacterium]|nr:hypothetical protein [Pseudobdellovibrionaceae bacterium]